MFSVRNGLDRIVRKKTNLKKMDDAFCRRVQSQFKSRPARVVRLHLLIETKIISISRCLIVERYDLERYGRSSPGIHYLRTDTGNAKVISLRPYELIFADIGGGQISAAEVAHSLNQCSATGVPRHTGVS
ncbi:hypothetical protein NPIL_397441 [Nephila pilipes]|uniref:Uncharacterized protein n=1 Tax=Nephila pilipes TaxID=299642 RepID=A0A8X6JZW0_NEPPI|nr:hypothetical protein NPIL_397441 [Nephila pilipes]